MIFYTDYDIALIFINFYIFNIKVLKVLACDFGECLARMTRVKNEKEFEEHLLNLFCSRCFFYIKLCD